jgi:hypothetical protein
MATSRRDTPADTQGNDDYTASLKKPTDYARRQVTELDKQRDKGIGFDESLNRPNNDGTVKGDDYVLQDRGTDIGVLGGEIYGAGIGMDETNSIGRIDAMSDPAFGGGPNFTARTAEKFRGASDRSLRTSLGQFTAKSDDAFDNTPDDPLKPDADDFE